MLNLLISKQILLKINFEILTIMKLLILYSHVKVLEIMLLANWV